MQRRRILWQDQRIGLAWQKDQFELLRQTHQGDVAIARLTRRRQSRSQLPLAAVDEHQVGHPLELQVAVRSRVQTASKYFPHHSEVVRLARYLPHKHPEPPILRLRWLPPLENDHAADTVPPLNRRDIVR